METAKEIIEVNNFEKRMLEEIKKWKSQREAMDKAYDEADSKFWMNKEVKSK